VDRKLKLLIVDDSSTCREYLKYLFEKDGGFQVVGAARDGLEAVRLAERLRPDVITMDINMPVMDGIEASRKILETRPVPIVMVSEVWDSEEVQRAFAAMEIGALAGVQKPAGLGTKDAEESARKLLRTVKLMAEVPVMRRLPSPAVSRSTVTSKLCCPVEGRNFQVVAMGASTGGPPVLKAILSRLPADYPLPVLVVQHISPGFLTGMVEWLRKVCRVHLRIATDGQRLRPATVYFAPDGFHMEVTGEGTLALRDAPPEHAVRPSVSFLFRSVAKVYGRDAVAVLLTGMGRDGAAELKELRDRGALTVAQNEETSVVFGMPGEAVRLGAARCVLHPAAIGDLLLEAASGRSLGVEPLQEA
jgi:two-component system chemotaxis response regulator CheB